MATHRFIQIHSLTSYPAALLNRDDAGLAKRIPFGGATRTRISSQCLKRHWRTFNGDDAISQVQPENMSNRSRHIFDDLIFDKLVKRGKDPEAARIATKALAAVMLGKRPDKGENDEDGKSAKRKGADDILMTPQVTVFGPAEVEFMLNEALRLCELAESKPDEFKAKVNGKEAARAALAREIKGKREENLRELALNAGLDAAMFGRMVTGDILARVDAALHVAHAFTVHGEQAESDYFSAVDDLRQEGPEAELGAGHINSSELTSGLYYGYVAIDVPGLVGNLGDDRKLAAEVVRRMVHLIATVSPGAKLGSTAPHAYAHLMLAEAASAQPRTLANAFLTPVRIAPDVIANAYDALAAHLGELDGCYGRTARNAIALGAGSRLAPVLNDNERAPSLAELARWVAARVEETE
jgi:CRISPR system Cascade subunit CasC